MEWLKAIALLAFIFVATLLLCWIATSPWVDSFVDVGLFMGGILFIALVGFLSIEDSANEM